MKRHQAVQYLPLIKAFAEGKIIQYRVRPGGTWEDINELNWLECYEYRIKPEPTKFWVVWFKDGDQAMQFITEREEALKVYKDNPNMYVIEEHTRLC